MPSEGKSVGRSVVAIVAGLLVTIVVTKLVDLVLQWTSVYPRVKQPLDDRLALIALSYRIVIGVGAAWLTARLAPGKPMKHALILGAVGVVFGLIGVVATWNMGLAPRWYPISLAVVAIPQCWLGGKIYELKSGRS
jgi:hypothetical protein